MPKGKKREKPQIKRWSAENPVIKAGIFQLLAQDFAKPKSFTKLWKHVKDNKICTKNTLVVYLEKMLETKEIVPVRTKMKVKKIKRQRYNYALPDWKEWAKEKSEYDKRLNTEAKRSRKVVHEMIRLLKSGELNDNEVFTLVYCTLLDFELKQLQGFDLLFKSQNISRFFASSIIQDFFEVPFNLRILFLWACHELCPESSKKAIVTLVNRKRELLDGLAYRDFLKIYGLIGNTSG
jgi:hypothetical protein